LFGERLALDVDTAFVSLAEGLIHSFREQEDHEGFKLAVIMSFGVDTSITREQLSRMDINTLTETLYAEVMERYERHKKEMQVQSVPVFKNIKLQQGSHIENVVVPFTDGKRGLSVLANMNKTLETSGTELTNALERTITLAVIDESWKEHLRSMDDLKQSVQTAYLEQKDPLVIYKMEAYNLFRSMNEEVNKSIVSFLTHSSIPLQDDRTVVKEGRQQKTDMSRMQVNKDEVDSLGDDYAANERDKPAPAVSGPRIGRNDACPCGSGKKFKQCHGKE